MARYRFKYIGPGNDYLRRECNDATVAVHASCDGATIDIECDPSLLDKLTDVLGYPTHFVYLGEVQDVSYVGEGPHSVDTLVPMLSDCRGFALIEVAISDAATREVYAWIELRVVRATASAPSIVATMQRFAAAGWSGVTIGLGANGESLTLEVELPSGMPDVKVEPKVHATRLS